ncbi:MAG: hypothetical protein WA974_19195 [Thermodesulfobacteriota bacterium]
MGMERRGCIDQPYLVANQQWEVLLRLIDGSRMSREIRVRFWEGVGVRFPHATRLH